MSDDRKPVWPWIAALLTGLPLLYVASFGPACGLVEQGILEPSVLRSGVFRPCYSVFGGPQPLSTLAWGWIRICGGEETLLVEFAKDALEECDKEALEQP